MRTKTERLAGKISKCQFVELSKTVECWRPHALCARFLIGPLAVMIGLCLLFVAVASATMLDAQAKRPMIKGRPDLIGQER